MPDTFTYTYGDIEQFFSGLEGLVGPPHHDFINGMELEHASEETFEAWNSETQRLTSARSEWAYVAYMPAGDLSVPDRGADANGRAGWRLQDFAKQPSIVKAKLLLAEVAGVRL